MPTPTLDPAYRKIECSLVLIDLSGFTQLLYQASIKEEQMRTVVLGMTRLFNESVKAAKSASDIHVINTTGDGFIAIATGTTPSRAALRYAQEVQAHFKHYVRSVLNSLPFRQRVDLRIALHHGTVYEINIEGVANGGLPLYIGDDINLIARVINSQVARRHGVALTRAFYRRLMKTKADAPSADEVILDRNRYPEQIEIYRLPKEIPEHKAKNDKA